MDGMYLGLKVGGEVAVFALRVPLLQPGVGAQGAVGEVELLAGREVLTLGVDALVVVDVVLPAVLGLVLVRKAGVETCSHELEGLGLSLFVGHFGRLQWVSR